MKKNYYKILSVCSVIMFTVILLLLNISNFVNSDKIKVCNFVWQLKDVDVNANEDEVVNQVSEIYTKSGLSQLSSETDLADQDSDDLALNLYTNTEYIDVMCSAKIPADFKSDITVECTGADGSVYKETLKKEFYYSTSFRCDKQMYTVKCIINDSKVAEIYTLSYTKSFDANITTGYGFDINVKEGKESISEQQNDTNLEKENNTKEENKDVSKTVKETKQPSKNKDSNNSSSKEAKNNLKEELLSNWFTILIMIVLIVALIIINKKKNKIGGE